MLIGLARPVDVLCKIISLVEEEEREREGIDKFVSAKWHDNRKASGLVMVDVSNLICMIVCERAIVHRRRCRLVVVGCLLPRQNDHHRTKWMRLTHQTIMIARVIGPAE